MLHLILALNTGIKCFYQAYQKKIEIYFGSAPANAQAKTCKRAYEICGTFGYKKLDILH